MKTIKKLRRITRISIIFSIIIVANIFLIFSNEFLNNSQNIKNDEIEKDNKPISFPKTSIFGESEWWDDSYEYRMLINITNSYSYDILNYGVNVSFNYANFLQENKIQTDLDDIRIVENGILKNFYVKKDYPSIDTATIWFDTDISASSNEMDTYMYFGNPSALNNESSSVSESFGWIKNGDFEIDYSASIKFNPYGWYFSHNPVQEIKGYGNPTPNSYNSSVASYNFFVNKLTTTPSSSNSAERLASGTYAYKWGAQEELLDDGTVHDYAGTLFSYPFRVPIIQGGELFLQAYRNIRTWRFERPKNPVGGSLNMDGYFCRILNGSNSIYSTDPDDHSDNDIYGSSFQNYAEAYEGNAYWNNPARKWIDDTTINPVGDRSTINNTYSNIIEGIPPNTYNPDGDLTGYVSINLTDYMGEEIFFEMGAWGDEEDTTNEEKSAFFQVDDVKFSYNLDTNINDIQARKSDVTVIVRDIDGRYVPNAEIFIVNNSAIDPIVDSKMSSSLNGSATFTELLNGVYNITVNYTIGSYEAEVYNSTELNKITYDFDGTNYIIEVQLDLWTIDFEFTDSDGIPFNYGYLIIKDDKGGTTIQTINLNSEGEALFRWLNASFYYYELYYNNEDYDSSPFLLNQSNYIYRSQYESSKLQQHTINVVNYNLAPSAQSRYLINERIYSNGSSTFNNRKIIQANISLTGMNDQLVNVSIYYVDNDNSTGTGDENLIYFEDGYGFGEDNDFISLDFLTINNNKLESEYFGVYGLNIIINGGNNTVSNGIVTVNLNETCHIFNKTELSRLNIRVININDLFPEGQPIDALIRVEDDFGQPLINLTAIATRNGYTYGAKNAYDIPFWFLKNRNYTFRIDVLNYTNIEFNVSSLDPDDSRWRPTSAVTSYEHNFNISMTITFNIIFETEINVSLYNTALFNVSGTDQVQWGEDLIYTLDFMYTEDNGANWDPVIDLGASCTLYITLQGQSEILLEMNLQANGNGNFSVVINSSLLSAGYNYKTYTIKITGHKPGYPLPNEVFKVSTITALPAEMSAYNYETLTVLPLAEYEMDFSELVNITVNYYDSDTLAIFENTLLTYTWLNQDPIIIQPDPINIGYYTFTLNTSDALSTGIESVKIYAYLENHSLIGGYFDIELTITERGTKLNGEIDPQPISTAIWIEDFEYFLFSYTDEKTDQSIGNLNIATFNWFEMDISGSFLNSSGGGTLIQNSNKSYTLDFNTGYKDAGYYLVIVSLKKDNYERKQVTILVNIKLREMEYDLTATNLNGNRINVVRGTGIDFQIQLNDLSRGGILLENANVTLVLNQNQYALSEISPGIYSFSLNTNQFDAFFSSHFLTGSLRIEVSNFTIQDINLNIVIKMEEIFPGMPTFYFILIISSILAISGSLIAYRAIHYARIPEYVKKIMKVRKVIKSKKKFVEPIKVPSKEKMIANIFGNEWKELGISLSKKLNVKGKEKLIKKEIITKEKEE
ncbi:MAG: hypothetical protein KGD63_12160 [Candidatus Lokiarchaeota archaeon]|nr:hypothetical protein [Candidatus Lokiarchaeota archaeon]